MVCVHGQKKSLIARSKIILEIAGEGCGGSFEKTADPSGIPLVSIPTVSPRRSTRARRDQVYLRTWSRLQESPRLGAASWRWRMSAFDRTLRYDEVDYIIEGTLEILIDGRKVTARRAT